MKILCTGRVARKFCAPKIKRAFTMIELVFVIVVLGIIAAIAIPRLNASRDDAKIVVALDQVTKAADELVGLAAIDRHDYSSDILTQDGGCLPDQVNFIKRHSLIPDAVVGYYDNAVFRIKTAIDDDPKKACVGIPATPMGKRYGETKIITIVYPLNSTPNCQRLAKMLDEKFGNMQCDVWFDLASAKMCELNEP